LSASAELLVSMLLGP